MHAVEEKIKSLGLILPKINRAVANYVPYQTLGCAVVISGQLPMEAGKILYEGTVGPDGLSLEDGQRAARLCAVNILAVLKDACQGDWEKVQKCLRIGGFVSSKSGFAQQPQVINGASDLMVDVFGEAGRHARAAVGVSSLPLNAAVEVEAMFVLKTE